VEKTGHSAAEVGRYLGIGRVNVLRAAIKGRRGKDIVEFM
jgi:hypothetical protein